MIRNVLRRAYKTLHINILWGGEVNPRISERARRNLSTTFAHVDVR